jgi:hypothetical protein
MEGFLVKNLAKAAMLVVPREKTCATQRKPQQTVGGIPNFSAEDSMKVLV